jgi:hypothetical protein
VICVRVVRVDGDALFVALPRPIEFSHRVKRDRTIRKQIASIWKCVCNCNPLTVAAGSFHIRPVSFGVYLTAVLAPKSRTETTVREIFV